MRLPRLRVRLCLAATLALSIAATPALYARGSDSTATGSTAADSTPPDLRALLVQINAEHPRVRARAEALAAKLSAADYQDWRYPDPSFGVAWSNYPYRKDLRLIDDMTPMTGIEFSLSQPIPFPGRLSLEAKLADIDAEAERLQLAIEKNAAGRDFLGALLEARSAEASITIADGFAERIETIAEVARARYSVGRAGLDAVSQAQARSTIYRDRLSKLRERRALIYAELQYLVEPHAVQNDADDAMANADASSSAAPADLRARLAPYWQAEANRASARTASEGGPSPDASSEQTPLQSYLRALDASASACAAHLSERSLAAGLADLQIDRAEKKASLARMNYLPDFEVFASYREREIIENDPAMGEDFMSFGFKMRVPLWSALSNHNNVEANDRSEAASRYQRADVLARERRLLQQSRIAEASARDRLQSYQDLLIPQAERAADATRSAYENGRGDFSAFLGSWELLYNLRIETEALKLERDRQILTRAFICNAVLPRVAPGETPAETKGDES